jgi:hypothetical protein
MRFRKVLVLNAVPGHGADVNLHPLNVHLADCFANVLIDGVEEVFRAQFANEVLFVAFNQQCA